jgi:hypothetical protein
MGHEWQRTFAFTRREGAPPDGRAPTPFALDSRPGGGVTRLSVSVGQGCERPSPGDLTDAEWAVMPPLRPSAPRRSRPRVHPIRRVLEARSGYGAAALRSFCLGTIPVDPLLPLPSVEASRPVMVGCTAATVAVISRHLGTGARDYSLV